MDQVATGITACKALDQLRPGHPRLMVRGSSAWDAIREQRTADPLFDQLLSSIEQAASSLLDQPTLTRKMIGRRLLGTSREALRRITLLAMAYHTSGERAYADRAEAEMLAVCGFSDWNPSLFLDVAEMALGVALGYDWLYDVLPEATRLVLRESLRDKALRHVVEPMATAGEVPKFAQGDSNWNPVCLAGMLTAALAIAEHHPQDACALLPVVAEYNPRAMKVLIPDGVYPEGTSYWSYGTTFQAVLLDVLDSGLATDLGLLPAPGLERSADFMRQAVGPSGMTFNFSDAISEAHELPALLWLARQYGRPGVRDGYLDDLRQRSTNEVLRFDTFAPLWWAAQGTADAADPLPCAWNAQGDQPLVVFRQAWNDPNSLWLAAKGGKAQSNHGHMDAGSFVFEADGVRWSEDLGMQDYESIESKGVNLWDSEQDAERWAVFRLNSRSHSTLTIDDVLHRVAGHAQVTRFSDETGNWHAVLDLTPVLGDAVQQAHRGFRVDAEAGVLVHDALSGLRPGSSVRWAMVTQADVAVHDDGRGATLTRDGRTLSATLFCKEAAARFDVIPASPPTDNFNAPNLGYQILIATAVAPDDGSLDLAVWLGRDGAQMPEGWSGLQAPGSW